MRLFVAWEPQPENMLSAQAKRLRKEWSIVGCHAAPRSIEKGNDNVSSSLAYMCVCVFVIWFVYVTMNRGHLNAMHDKHSNKNK